MNGAAEPLAHDEHKARSSARPRPARRTSTLYVPQASNVPRTVVPESYKFGLSYWPSACVCARGSHADLCTFACLLQGCTKRYVAADDDRANDSSTKIGLWRLQAMDGDEKRKIRVSIIEYGSVHSSQT